MDRTRWMVWRFARRRMTRSGRRDLISYRHRTCTDASVILIRILFRISTHARAQRHAYPYRNRFCLCATTQNTHRPFTRSHVNYYFFIPDLSRVACNLTISREGDTYTRGDSIVMDRERNFSRDGRMDEWQKKPALSALFRKGTEKKGDNHRRAFGMYLDEPRNMRLTRDLPLGEIFYQWLPALPVLPAPNARPMIDNGETGSPIFFFFF